MNFLSIGPVIGYILIICFVHISCNNTDKNSADKNAQNQHTVNSKVNKKSKPSARATKELLRDFLKEAGRAELNHDGLLIDFGTSDQHKYTRGHWQSGWREPDSGDTPSSEIFAASALLTVNLQNTSSHFFANMRTEGKNNQIKIYSGKKLMGQLDVGPTWKKLSVPIEKLHPGVHHLKILKSDSQHTGVGRLDKICHR